MAATILLNHRHQLDHVVASARFLWHPSQLAVKYACNTFVYTPNPRNAYASMVFLCVAKTKRGSRLKNYTGITLAFDVLRECELETLATFIELLNILLQWSRAGSSDNNSRRCSYCYGTLSYSVSNIRCISILL